MKNARFFIILNYFVLLFTASSCLTINSKKMNGVFEPFSFIHFETKDTGLAFGFNKNPYVNNDTLKLLSYITYDGGFNWIISDSLSLSELDADEGWFSFDNVFDTKYFSYISLEKLEKNKTEPIHSVYLFSKKGQKLSHYSDYSSVIPIIVGIGASYVYFNEPSTNRITPDSSNIYILTMDLKDTLKSIKIPNRAWSLNTYDDNILTINSVPDDIMVNIREHTITKIPFNINFAETDFDNKRILIVPNEDAIEKKDIFEYSGSFKHLSSLDLEQWDESKLVIGDFLCKDDTYCFILHYNDSIYLVYKKGDGKWKKINTHLITYHSFSIMNKKAMFLLFDCIYTFELT